MRFMEGMTLEERKEIGEDELQKIANRQLFIGYIGISF